MCFVQKNKHLSYRNIKLDSTDVIIKVTYQCENCSEINDWIIKTKMLLIGRHISIISMLLIDLLSDRSSDRFLLILANVHFLYSLAQHIDTNVKLRVSFTKLY